MNRNSAPGINTNSDSPYQQNNMSSIQAFIKATDDANKILPVQRNGLSRTVLSKTVHLLNINIHKSGGSPEVEEHAPVVVEDVLDVKPFSLGESHGAE